MVGLLAGASPLDPESAPDFEPMSGQFLLEAGEPLEPFGVVLVDPEEFVEVLVPEDAVPDPLAGVELVVPVFDVLDVFDVLVAALAASAPPATRPLVSAPMAIALRSLSFMVVCPFSLMAFVLPHMREHNHCAIWICAYVHKPVTTR